MKPLYTITFENNSKYRGGSSYQDTKWVNVPNDKRIKRIFYKLPNMGYLKLENFDNYYQCVEATMNLTGRKKGKLKLCYAYIMGQKGIDITCYKIKLVNKPTEEIVSIQTYNENDKFIMTLNSLGWKLGGG